MAACSTTRAGDTPLVDQSGAANLIKPLGLFFPLSLVLIAIALAKLGHRWQAPVVLIAALAWPIAHIANIATLAVAVNVAPRDRLRQPRVGRPGPAPQGIQER